MIPRYSRPAMTHVWSEVHTFELWLEVEIAACEAWAGLGVISPDEVAKIKRAKFDQSAYDRHFAATKHDLISFTRAVAESLGPESRWVHYGLTSNDVKDTALSLQMRESLDLIDGEVARLMEVLRRRAEEFRDTPCIGRSHGVHAEPMSFGLKFALWWDEMRRHRERISETRRRVNVGKISGPVGTYASVPPDIEEYACRQLGLTPAPVSNQVVQRDRHAEFVQLLALISASLEKFATEVRNLQRTEVREVEEPFGQPGYVTTGSSSMPHKRNPELSERVCGLARLVRGYSITALENVALWHERDISHSSAERIVLPDSALAVDYMLDLFTGIISGLKVSADRMMQNLELTRGLVFSPRVMLALVEAGMDRKAAYELIQTHSMRSWETGNDFRESLASDGRVTSVIGADVLKTLFDYAHFLKHVDHTFMRLGFTTRAAVTDATFETNLPGPVHRGKVRDTYDIGGGLLLMIATDRISAFDVVLPTPVAGKGLLLARMSEFWFALTQSVVPNHMVGMANDKHALSGVPRTGALAQLPDKLAAQSMVIRKADRINMECVVRGYLAGSAWNEYKEHGTVNGAQLPRGLREAERLPVPLFTPSTKAEAGHDLPLTRAEGEALVGRDLYRRLETTSIAVFNTASAYAATRGMIIADTKMEFGFIDGVLMLIDELLTPDSSRFWDAKDWKPGATPPAYDKQFVRNWLIGSGWNKEPPAPALPTDIIEKTRTRYLDAYRRLTGHELDFAASAGRT